MALRSKIQAFEHGGVSNLTPNSKRKRSIFDAEVDQKIDLFESLKGQEEGHRHRGPMYRRFGNLKQKFEADLRALQSEEDKENIVNRNPASPGPATLKSSKEEALRASPLSEADGLAGDVSTEEVATNAARVAELEEMVQLLEQKYNSRKNQVHVLKKQKLDLESLVSAQREEHKRCLEVQKQSEEEVQRLQEQNKFLSEGYEDVKEEMRKKAELIRGKVLRDELRKELEDKRKLREERREKQRTTASGEEVEEAARSAPEEAAQLQERSEEEAKKKTAAREEEERRRTKALENEIAERVRAEYKQRDEAEVRKRTKAIRAELEREIGVKLELEKAKLEEALKHQAETAQRKEEEFARMRKELKRKREEEFESQTEALRGDNERLSREIRDKQEELQTLRSDVVALQEAIENIQQEMTLEASEWESMKACLEKEVHRAYKELKAKEEKEAHLLDEIRALKDELQQAVALVKQQQQHGRRGENEEGECQNCGGSKRRKVEEVTAAAEQETTAREQRPVAEDGERATRIGQRTAAKETGSVRTPVRPQLKRTGSVVIRRTSEAKAAAVEKDTTTATKQTEEEKSARRRSQAPSVGTPRPATTKTTTSSSRATLAARDKGFISSLQSSSSATLAGASPSSPLRRASLAPATPRKGSVRDKSTSGAAGTSASSSSHVTAATASPRRKKERPSSVFASATPRFDAKVDPLRYEKLTGRGGNAGADAAQ